MAVYQQDCTKKLALNFYEIFTKGTMTGNKWLGYGRGPDLDKDYLLGEGSSLLNLGRGLWFVNMSFPM